MDLILTIHGLMRWLVAIAGLVAIIKFAYGWLSKADYTPLDKRIMSIFTILLDNSSTCFYIYRAITKSALSS